MNSCRSAFRFGPAPKRLRARRIGINEKTLARQLGAMTADFAPIDSLEALIKTLDGGFAVPAVLKTRRFGYDGKGQAKILKRGDAEAAWAAMRGQPSILESFVNFRAEVSIVAARASRRNFQSL